MTEPSVRAEPEFGSAEHRAGHLRRHDRIMEISFGIAEVIVSDRGYGAARKIELLENVFAAYRTVYAERAAADTGLGFDSSQLAGADATPIPASRRYPPHLEDGRTGQVVEETCGTPTDRGPCARQAGHLAMHTAAAPKVPATDPGDVPQVQMAASGLTIEADQSRGPLAGTTPVVTYFSFGHGQTDPDSGKQLLGHYVTVVAPTYEACREAMFASRFGRAWSFDYLAGTDRATAWIPEWTEHEVIVAPGTEPAGAESALKAARDVLDGVVPF